MNPISGTRQQPALPITSPLYSIKKSSLSKAGAAIMWSRNWRVCSKLVCGGVDQ
jgi:predicted  nucleic acid-binding Zn ribbon protein